MLLRGVPASVTSTCTVIRGKRPATSCVLGGSSDRTALSPIQFGELLGHFCCSLFLDAPRYGFFRRPSRLPVVGERRHPLRLRVDDASPRSTRGHTYSSSATLVRIRSLGAEGLSDLYHQVRCLRAPASRRFGSGVFNAQCQLWAAKVWPADGTINSQPDSGSIARDAFRDCLPAEVGHSWGAQPQAKKWGNPPRLAE